ncbi:MAG: YciI family protein [Polyangiaceae bacterium]
MTTHDEGTYALLIYRTDQGLDAEDEARALAGHRELQATARADLHAVAKLDRAHTAHTVRVRGAAHAVTDGPHAEVKEWLVGFYLLDCTGLDQAIERAQTICPVAGHAVEVRRVDWRWKP